MNNTKNGNQNEDISGMLSVSYISVHSHIKLIIHIIFLFWTSSFASTYFVATNGNDAYSGSENQPWQTIQKASNTLVAGDIVYIKSGTYNERVIPKNSGTADNFIIYSSYSSDEVTIDGDGISLPNDDLGGLFEINNKAYIRVSGLKVINAQPYDNSCGILVNNSNNIIIENNYTYNTASSGIGVWDSENIIIDGNEIELACNDGEQECISVAVTNGFEIKNNIVHHGGSGTIGGEGICPKDGSSNGKVFNNFVYDIPNRLGIYCDAWDKHTYNIEIYNNIIRDCGANGITISSEMGGLSENITVFNNVIYNNKNIGIEVTPNGDVPDSPMKKIFIVNNTIFNNGWNIGDESWGGGIGIDSPNLSELVIRNNIVSSNLLFQIFNDDYGNNFSIDHNLIDGFREELLAETRGVNYVEANPLFVNSFGADFHLKENSPAIDKGSTIQVANVDFDGNARPIGSGIDIGAFEYGSPTSIFNSLDNSIRDYSLRQNFPNPFNPSTQISYIISKDGLVTLKIYDIIGKEVSTLLKKMQKPGEYVVKFNASNFSSGVYIYRLIVNSNDAKHELYNEAKKMMILK